MVLPWLMRCVPLLVHVHHCKFGSSTSQGLAYAPVNFSGSCDFAFASNSWANLIVWGYSMEDHHNMTVPIARDVVPVQ